MSGVPAGFKMEVKVTENGDKLYPLRNNLWLMVARDLSEFHLVETDDDLEEKNRIEMNRESVAYLVVALGDSWGQKEVVKHRKGQT